MTPIEIINFALDDIGAAAINSLTSPTTKTEHTCARQYPALRDEMLAFHNWSFAKVNIALAVVATSTPLEYNYAYSYPSDCLVPRYIYNSLGRSATEIPFETVSDGAGNNSEIHTDQEGAVLIYTKRDPVENRFTPGFIKSLRSLLASRLAIPVVQDKNLAKLWGDTHRVDLVYAMTQDAKAQKYEKVESYSFLDARA